METAGGGESDEGGEAIAAYSEGAGAGFEDGPSLHELEAQMGDEVSTRDTGAAAAASRRGAKARPGAEEDGDEDAASGGKAGPLPELDTLVARLSPEVRETLEELFRARFVSVKKLPKRVLSSEEPPA